MAEPTPRSSPLRQAVQAVVAILVSAVALWISFKDVELGVVFERLKSSHTPTIVVFVLAQLVIHIVRVFRWGLLVGPLGTASKRAIFSAASVGIPAAMFLPLRLGELVRPAMIARAGVPFPRAMASVVTERLADGLTNVGLFFTLLMWMPQGALPDNVRRMAQLALFGFGSACLVLVIMVTARAQSERLLLGMLRPISPKLAERVGHVFGAFVDGLKPLAQPRRLVGFIALTVVYWAINGGMTTVLARSYGLNIPWLAGPFAIIIVVFAVTLPAGPAFAGTLQLGFLLGLAPFGVNDDQAALVAIAVHLIQILTQAVLLGLGFLTAEPGQRARE